MAKPTPVYEHKDQYNKLISVGNIVAFTVGYSNRIQVGRVGKLTAKRVRIDYTMTHYGLNGVESKWSTNYQAHPSNILVLNNIEQELTMMALKGLV